MGQLNLILPECWVVPFGLNHYYFKLVDLRPKVIK